MSEVMIIAHASLAVAYMLSIGVIAWLKGYRAGHESCGQIWERAVVHSRDGVIDACKSGMDRGIDLVASRQGGTSDG